MKKAIVFMMALAALTACTSTNFKTTTVGWSDYVDMAVKDFESLGIITLETKEVVSVSPLALYTEHTGSRVTYGALFAEAAKLKADDIINVRIDVKTEERTTVFDWLIGSTTTYTYTGTALAIKYTNAVERVKSANQKELGP